MRRILLEPCVEFQDCELFGFLLQTLTIIANFVAILYQFSYHA